MRKSPLVVRCSMNSPDPELFGKSGVAGRGGALVLWLSGLSGAGKSTIAKATMERFVGAGLGVLNLDGDAVRDHLHRNLGFSEPDVIENNRLIAEICKDRSSEFDLILAPVIAPLECGRENARRIIGARYRLVYCSADIATVRDRDVKGLYARADRGEIGDMIGYSEGAVAYEPPTEPDLVLPTADESTDACVDRLCAFIQTQLAAR